MTAKTLATRQLRVGCVVLFVALLLGAGATGAWWSWSQRPAAVDPPMPPEIEETEVRLAVERARQKVIDNPHSGDAWGRLGMTLLAHLFDREADRCFAEAARLAPGDARWPYARGLIALKRDPDNALPLLRQAVAASDAWLEGRFGVRMQLGEALLARRELDEAEQIFKEELARAPGNDRVAFDLGLVAGERGNDGAAEEYFAAVRNSPFGRKKATAQLAALARARGDTAAAGDYEKQINALPDDPLWPDPFLDPLLDYKVGYRRWEHEVSELEHQGHFAEAANIYLKQIEEQPTSRACVGAGLNLARLHDYQRALPLLREGVRLDPESAQAHYTLAATQFRRAERELRQSPQSTVAKEWLQETVEHAKRTAELKPDLARNYLHWGLALKYLGQPAAAVAPLHMGVICRPVDVDLQFALGEVLLETGEDKDAEKYLKRAQELDPKDPRVTDALERLRRKKD